MARRFTLMRWDGGARRLCFEFPVLLCEGIDEQDRGKKALI